MNLLTDPLPQFVELDGMEVPVNTDHRSCMQAVNALLDSPALTEEDALAQALLAFYPYLPEHVSLEEALIAEQEFLAGVPLPSDSGADSGGKPTERAYSFVHDQCHLVAAFRQQYGIDLTEETLHWWVFKALLGGLRDNLMADLMYMRTADESAAESKKEREEIRKRKKRYALPKPAQETARTDALVAALQNGGEGLEELLCPKE